MKSILFLLLVMSLQQRIEAQSIFGINIDSANSSSQISFSAFRGKKVLIVTLASQDTSFNQFPALQQMALMYQKTLVVVIIPTNSFGSETAAIGSSSAYSKIIPGSVIIASNNPVTGTTISPLFQWLTKQSLNGAVDSQVKSPGYKYLLNANGNLVGVFTSQVRPFDNSLTAAINNSF